MSISVAMCTYNGSKFLKEQFESIRNQTLLPSELVVCDDGSGDETAAMLDSVAASFPFPVRIYLNAQNLGSNRNFEKAICLCNGDWIALCDQDDIWEPEKLRTLNDRATESTGGMFSDAQIIDAQSRKVGMSLWQSIQFAANEQQRWKEGDCLLSLLKRDMVTGATMLFRSNLRHLVLPIPDGWVHDGWIAWMLALHATLDAVPEPLIRYRVHGKQQFGAPTDNTNFFQKLRRARRTGADPYLARAHQLSILLEYLKSCSCPKCAQIIPALTGQIDHCRFRARVRSNDKRMVREVVSRYREYRVYSEGITSMLRDLALGE